MFLNSLLVYAKGASNRHPSQSSDHHHFNHLASTFQRVSITNPASDGTSIPHIYLNLTPDSILQDQAAHAQQGACCRKSNLTHQTKRNKPLCLCW